MASERESRAIRLGRSLVVTIPKDWARWNKIEPGDKLNIVYDGNMSVSASKKQEKNDLD